MIDCKYYKLKNPSEWIMLMGCAGKFTCTLRSPERRLSHVSSRV